MGIEPHVDFMAHSLKHVAVIMDGNGRWAQARKLPRVSGHKQGALAFKEVVRTATEFNIPYLTAYAFSSQNWRRPVSEVRSLFGLFEHYLEQEEKDLLEQNIRLRVIGECRKLPPSLQQRIRSLEKASRHNTGLALQIAFNYGSREELVQAARLLAQDVKDGKLNPQEVTEQTINQYLYTHDIPDPDLLIRTSGEQRISNYLLWQIAYTELVFVDKCWPDFGRQDIIDALATYQGRMRRFGAVAA
jgi:undecaprenyl diphosphate synthase